MGDQVPVNADGVEFYVEVADVGGPQTVALGDAFSLDDVESTIRAIGSSLVRAWKVVRPAEASVEFNLSLTAKNGKLTGLLVEGETEASLKITMTWKSEPQ